MGWVLGIAFFSPFVLCLDFSNPERETLSDVTGRVTYSGRPLNDMTICLDLDGLHSAFSTLKSDGSFRLLCLTGRRAGAFRGRYHAHLYSNPGGPSLPAKYVNPDTSGLELEIATDWNDFKIDLN
jgi:hypothetical protein